LKRPYKYDPNARLLTIVAAVVVIAALYFARVVFMPLALALLFSLLLSPAVTFLEKIKLPRVLAISFVMLGLIGLVAFIGWRTSQQFIDLSDQIPTYKKTLEDKIHSLKGSGSQSINKATDTMKELGKEIGSAAQGSSTATDTRKVPAPLGSSPTRPMAVELVPSSNPLESMENLLGPLVTGGAVIIFTIFILAGREDLRNRLIRLAGGGRLHLVTQAMDDASRRINRYLLLQLVVNSAYGGIIAVGLHFIEIPNAVLWGVGAAILRFLPYIGPPLSALVPIILALAVFPGWHHAVLTAGMFLVLELVVSNFVEPLLYSSQVGLSPLAILVSAVFWTLIWGFPGLVLSTPLTACLVVMGRYLPSLNFLSVLLGDEPTLAPHAQYYQRLLASDRDEARKVLDLYLKNRTLQELYSDVVIPALGLAEHDRHRNVLDEETQQFIQESTKEIVAELGNTPSSSQTETATETGTEPSPNLAAHGHPDNGHLEILCIPARDHADALVAMLLSQLLQREGHTSRNLEIGSTEEILAQVAQLQPDRVCISALPPSAVSHASALHAVLRTQFPELQIMICLWQFEGDPQKAAARMGLPVGSGFFTTLPDVLKHADFRTRELVSAENT
jgi:predicted PurR-regulated permease PerM